MADKHWAKCIMCIFYMFYLLEFEDVFHGLILINTVVVSDFTTFCVQEIYLNNIAKPCAVIITCQGLVDCQSVV